MTQKKSRAVKAALTAFRALMADEEAYVLKELGLVRAPRLDPPKRAAGPSDASVSDEHGWVDDLMADPGEGIGLPHPSLMSPEQRAIHHPPRPRTISKAATRALAENEAKKG